MLIDILTDEYRVKVKVLAYVDDFLAVIGLEDLIIWWNVLKEIGPKFEYYPEPKTFSVTKHHKAK